MGDHGAYGQVTALDMNPAMLAVARALPAPSGAAIRWQEGHAMALPFADGAFDLVLCQHGLPFFPDRAAAVREMHRVLAPGGRALAIVLQALDRHPVFDVLMKSVAAHLSLPLSAVMTPVRAERCRAASELVPVRQVQIGGRRAGNHHGPICRAGAFCATRGHQFSGGRPRLRPAGWA